MTLSSAISGFHKLSQEEKVRKIQELVGLTEDEVAGLQVADAPVSIENIIGVMTVPIGLATNFTINGKDRFVTLAVEEASVVAAASHAAKIAREHGGFTTSTTGPYMIGQIQLLDVFQPHFASQTIHSSKDRLIQMANEQDPILVKFGGGATDITTRVIETAAGQMLIVHLVVNCLDAMGANAVNTMVEAIAPELEKLTGGEARLRIISNLADRRLVRSRAIFDKDMLGGSEIVEAIFNAWAFADADPYRAATHNKGIMNAISAITLATANDWRAIEAGAHAYAAKDGYYSSLTTYEITDEGHLAGTIELPLALGTIGGATKIHPIAQTCLKIMQVEGAQDLAEIVASAGLAQNLAALRALSDEGIQKGHMKLHAANIAKSVGAEDEEIEKVAEVIVKEGAIRMDRAEEVLKELRG
ncbi:MAG: hydroxymethylglutaryl-CoA reductase, degradative [Candidatus Kariarchaeaceae archaeon]|jgi:hydroxymethylglutaryl-CoA reductase